MRNFLLIFFFLVLITSAEYAEGVTAIGTFSRNRETPVTREVILRFPVYLSKAYLKAQKGKIMYPNEFIRLREQNKIPAKVLYTPDEYSQIAKIIPGGGLVTGEVTEYEIKKENEEDSSPEAEEMPGKKMVFVRIHHFNAITRKIVSFSIYSTPESVVIDLVKRLLPLDHDRYLLNPILPGKKIAVITPLDAVSLNNFLGYLLALQYDLRMANGYDYEIHYPDELEPLREIRSRIISYTTPSLPIELPPPTDTQDEAEKHTYKSFSSIYKSKYTGFENNLRKILNSIRKKTEADYLLVFQPHGKKPFARGFDLKRGGMVWFQDSFPSKSSSAGEVLASMIAEMQRPMKTLKEEQFRNIETEKDKIPSSGASGGLASVAILNFYDRTNTPLYGWMSSSLSIAVDDSMKKIFEFERANEKVSDEAGTRIFRSPSDINSKKLEEFKKVTGADYLIFGFYSLNKATGNIVIESKVYDLTKKTSIGGSVTESPVDVRLFNVVDEISRGIVQDIFSMAQQQQK